MSLSAAKPVRILSVGRLVAFKGFEYLIEACEQMRQRSVKFRCEIIGDGPLRESLQEQIDELRLRSSRHVDGRLPQEDVFEKLQRCDIFALASTIDDRGASDIFPTVILEAMASARPVVSTDVAGIPEAVVDKETGLLVPAGESGLFRRRTGDSLSGRRTASALWMRRAARESRIISKWKQPSSRSSSSSKNMSATQSRNDQQRHSRLVSAKENRLSDRPMAR